MIPASTDGPNPATGWGVNGVILLALSFGMYFGAPVFVPAVIGLLLACVLWPVVAWLGGRGVPWAAAATGVALAVFALVAVATYALAQTVPRLVNAIPGDSASVQALYTRFRDRVERVAPWAADDQVLPEKADDSPLVQYARSSLDPQNPRFTVNTLFGVRTAGYSLLQVTLVLFILYFFLLEGRLLVRRLVEAISPEGDARAHAASALREMATQLRSYLFWRTAINVGMAVALGFLFQASGLSKPWVWAALTGVLLYVPYLGAIVAAGPPLADAFLSVESPWVTLGVLLTYVAAVTIEGYFIVPLVMGRGMALNATTVLLTTLYWDLVWGPAGLFLSMPLMAMAKTIATHVPGWLPWARLMGTEHDDPPALLGGEPAGAGGFPPQPRS